jgi:hypothetical protein
MCVYKYHAFIYFLRPPPWLGTIQKVSFWVLSVYGQFPSKYSEKLLVKMQNIGEILRFIQLPSFTPHILSIRTVSFRIFSLNVNFTLRIISKHQVSCVYYHANAKFFSLRSSQILHMFSIRYISFAYYQYMLILFYVLSAYMKFHSTYSANITQKFEYMGLNLFLRQLLKGQCFKNSMYVCNWIEAPQWIIDYLALVLQKISFCILSEYMEMTIKFGYLGKFEFILKKNVGSESGDKVGLVKISCKSSFKGTISPDIIIVFGSLSLNQYFLYCFLKFSNGFISQVLRLV